MFTRQAAPHRTLENALPWFAPGFLAIGILLSLFFHWNLAIGLLIGFLATFFQALRYMPILLVLKHSFLGAKGLVSIAAALVLIAIVLGLWADSGVIREVTEVCRLFVQPNNVVWIGFLSTALLSMIIGSSIATWSILVPPMLALSSAHDISLLAGALVSGAMVGDRTSPMSTSLLVMSRAASLPHFPELKQAIKSAIVPFGLAGIAFYLANTWWSTSQPHAASASLFVWSQAWLLIAPIVVILLAVLRVPLLWNFAIASLLAVFLALFHPVTHGQLLSIILYGAKVSVSGSHVSDLGGLKSMINLCLIILLAGAFQGVTARMRVTERLTQGLFAHAKRPLSRTGTAMLVATSFSLLMGSQSLSILMTGNALLAQLSSYNLPNSQTLQILADTSELLPAIIPWNILGLQAATILSIPTFSYIPFVWYIWITIAFCAVSTWQALKKQSVPVSCPPEESTNST